MNKFFRKFCCICLSPLLHVLFFSFFTFITCSPHFFSSKHNASVLFCCGEEWASVFCVRVLPTHATRPPPRAKKPTATKKHTSPSFFSSPSRFTSSSCR